MRSGKIEIDTATGFILALLFILVVVGILFSVKELFIGEDLSGQLPCWITNNIKYNGAIFSLIPSGCSLQVVDDVNMEKFASLIRGTWWMFLQGEEDFGNTADEIFPVYAIVPNEDISLEEYFSYILTTNKGKKTSDIAHSDYAYLEANTDEQTLCFDQGTSDSIKNLYLEKGKTYYIMFYDDQPPSSIGGDRILISSDPDFDATSWISKASFTTLGAVAGTFTTGSIVGGIVGFNINSYSESECIIYTSNLLGEPEE